MRQLAAVVLLTVVVEGSFYEAFVNPVSSSACLTSLNGLPTDSKCSDSKHTSDFLTRDRKHQCRKTCRLEIIETIPDHVTFGDEVIPRSTADAWNTLLSIAEKSIDIAAYKSSLRGFHLLNKTSLLLPSLAVEGEDIFDAIVNASLKRHIAIRMVENFPPKDPGDNADGVLLERDGVIKRKSLNFQELFGYGSMHSKFLVVDERHFYLGSANLDWRSLSQKMELGVLVSDCPCLASTMGRIFETYWELTSSSAFVKESSSNAQIFFKYNHTNVEEEPLTLMYKGTAMDVQLAASPFDVNGVIPWDLLEITSAIDRADRFVYIHVMDYIPMFVYRNPPSYWPTIDEAIRRAAVNRGVQVRILVAALHFVEQMFGFMNSLLAVDGITEGGTIEAKIFNVPVVTEDQKLVARDRRTHNKFMVTEETVIIGTSNWSGDYFYSSTGLALVLRQKDRQRPFIEEMRNIFLRDWDSEYAHSLKKYRKQCLSRQASPSSICHSPKSHVQASF